MKKFFSLLLAAALVLSGTLSVTASAIGVDEYVSVTGYDPAVDYAEAILNVLEDGGPYAMQIGAIYEKQRNLKIDKMKLPRKKTTYFTDYSTAAEIKKAMEDEKAPKYTSAELDLLSRIIYAEAGCSWFPDWVQQMVGSVVLNRVTSSVYPNNIHDVIYQPGQYSPTWNGSINKKPDSRTVANAKFLLENGSICPSNVTGQNSIITGGGVYKSYYDSVLGTTIYFCYT